MIFCVFRACLQIYMLGLMLRFSRENAQKSQTDSGDQRQVERKYYFVHFAPLCGYSYWSQSDVRLL